MRKKKSHDFQIKFEKYHGLGNDFIFISNSLLKKFKTLSKLKNFVIKICQRNDSIGADGVIFFHISKSHQKIKILIVNSDGSLAGTCGNALRCVGLKLFRDDVWKGKKSVPIFRLGLPLRFKNSLQPDELFANNLKKPFATLVSLKAQSGDVSAIVDILFDLPKDIYYWDKNTHSKTSEATSAVFVQLENPHIVFLSQEFENFDHAKYAEFGTQIQQFSNVNVNMLTVSSPNLMQACPLRVYERGAGLTRACGSGAAASALALQFANFIPNNRQPVTLQMPGGAIKVYLKKNQITISAQAKFVFCGTTSMMH